MKRLLGLATLFCTLGLGLSAQTFVEVAMGGSYSEHSFYNLEDDKTTVWNNEEWDLAFSTFGLQDAGVHINEATSLMGTALEAYLAPALNFEDDIDVDELEMRLYNPEVSWAEGAFNSLRDANNPGDLGWGEYNPATRSVEGVFFFVIKLRSGAYKKFEIQSLAGTTYNFRFANLDGTGEQAVSFDKTNYSQDGLVFFSFNTEELTTVPQSWDLLFTRYSSLASDNMGNVQEYVVGGTLSGLNVTIAQADDIDPETVQYASFKDSMSANIDIIGYDWKSFDLNNFKWVLVEDRAYFVKDHQGKVWKIIFVDFEGSSTGNSVFTKEEVMTSSLNTVDFTGAFVYPNPTMDQIQFGFELEKAMPLDFSVYSLDGKEIMSWNNHAQAGFQVLNIPVSQLKSGQYQLVVKSENGLINQSFTKL